jgi:hypothetical protein
MLISANAEQLSESREFYGLSFSLCSAAFDCSVVEFSTSALLLQS